MLITACYIFSYAGYGTDDSIMKNKALSRKEGAVNLSCIKTRNSLNKPIFDVLLFAKNILEQKILLLEKFFY